MIATRLRSVCLVFATLLLAMPASAASGKLTVVPTNVFTTVDWIPANTQVTYQTSNLSPTTGDTVLHVTTDLGMPIASNDDFQGLTSRVVVPPSGAGRFLRVFVRSFSPNTRCAGTLTVTIGTVARSYNSMPFAGTAVPLPAGLAGGANLHTVRQQGGATDTILIYLRDNVTVLRADEDSGLNNMAAIANYPFPCDGASCKVIVGSFQMSPEANTTFIYDEQANTLDSDSDGLGDALEAQLSTSAWNADSDFDGLSDAAEVVGVAASPDQSLPTWGADPNYPDVFIEADWKSTFQLNTTWTNRAVNHFWPRVHAHIDRGVANTDPASWHLYGDWGGAGQVASNAKECEGFTSARAGLFHHVTVTGSGGGGQTKDKPCSFVGFETVAHEVGHQLGLGHGGYNTVNCKPNYYSTMNYAYQSNLTYSDGSLRTINGAFMNENVGLGTTNADVLNRLSGAPYLHTVNFTTGGVDWNRDGLIGGTVQASPLMLEEYGSCGMSEQAARNDGQDKDAPYVYGEYENATLAWAHTSPPRLYMIARWPSGGGIHYRYTTQPSVDTCFDSPGRSCAQFTPPAGSQPTNIVQSEGPGELGAAYFTDGQSRPDLAVFYVDLLGRLRYRAMLNPASGAPTILVGGPYWTVGASAITIGGKPHIYTIKDDGAGSGRLEAHIMNPGVTSVFTIEDVLWSDGTPVISTLPPALVRAPRHAGDPTVVVYALIVGLSGRVEFAEFDETTRRWTRRPEVFTLISPPGVTGRTGLAYRPFPEGGGGRFYMAWSPKSGTGAPNLSALAITEGNRRGSATDHRFMFLARTLLAGEWSKMRANTGVSLALEWERGYDRNVRMALTHSDGKLQFAPLADGIYNMDMSDHDDLTAIIANLDDTIW